jgi:hypothetical protein
VGRNRQAPPPNAKKREKDEGDDFGPERMRSPKLQKTDIHGPANRQPSTKEWRESASRALPKRAETTFTFPEPPAWPCGRRECGVYRFERVLRAWKHKIQTAFEGMEVKELSRASREWHPDRFEVRCKDEEEAKKELW